MNEFPEQLGLKGISSSKMGWNDIEKLFSRPKVVVCSNSKLFRKNDCVTVLNCSLISGDSL
jgi:hypothetical protein